MESPTTARDSQESPARNSFAITPDDSAEVGTIQPRAIYVGVSGDITMSLYGDGGVDTVWLSVPVGILPVHPKFIRATGTTASGIIGLY